MCQFGMAEQLSLAQSNTHKLSDAFADSFDNQSALEIKPHHALDFVRMLDWIIQRTRGRTVQA